jgi:filamentous hemagglutinin
VKREKRKRKGDLSTEWSTAKDKSVPFLNNVADLTNPAARDALGITLDQLTNTAHGAAAYSTTQRISAWARSQGYQAILAPSAQNPNGANLISFNSLGPPKP